MKRLAAAALLASAMLPALATATLADSTDDEQAKLAEVGRAIAREHCSRCHAIGPDDKSPHDKAPPFRDVVVRYPSEDLAEALAEGIVSGHPDMPVFVFEGPQIEGFIAYLDSLGPPEAKTPAK
ncbi:MAG: cytochrome c [Hyphomicrobiaceae bacterium]|nr:cytochrome c [Hyphomicrobiaceae bacterium]